MTGRFVIQQHDATTMHWDFRIEVAGTLKSWSVPKGPSTNPADKRLAIATPDHSLSYADFEGMISKGEYGAGPVIVWDRGTYRNATTDDEGAAVPVDEALRRGHVKLWLDGVKMAGGYALRKWGQGKKWLLVKVADEHAVADVDITVSRPESVLSGRTVAEVSG